MSDSERPEVGAVGWFDLTVPEAEKIRDFYSAVTGWRSEPVDMGDYNDFSMTLPGSGQPIGGICHARGSNAGLPPAWLVYITVDDVDASAKTCSDLGGEIVTAPRDMGSMGRFCVIQDPAGAVAALFAYKK